MAIGRAGKTINDLSDKVFSIVKASGGGSKGGGSTGGGSKGGGATGGGRDEGATEDDPTGPPVTDDGGDAGATLKITSPSPGQEFESGEASTISWEATGAARVMNICLKVIDPFGDAQHITELAPKASYRLFFQTGGEISLGVWTIRVSALFKGDSCSATVDNFGTESDNPRSEIKFTIKAPEALCGNNIVEGSEVCDYAGVMCQGRGTQSKSFCSTTNGVQTCAIYYVGARGARPGNVVRCENCVAQKVIFHTVDVLYYNRNDIPSVSATGRQTFPTDFPNNRICPGFVP
jgi:hypothetical protein